MWIPTEASRYGQAAARGTAETTISGITAPMEPAPISAKARVWSLMPWAMAFQTAWVTAAPSTARVTPSVRVFDGSNEAPQARLNRSPQGFYPVRCSPGRSLIEPQHPGRGAARSSPGRPDCGCPGGRPAEP